MRKESLLKLFAYNKLYDDRPYNGEVDKWLLELSNYAFEENFQVGPMNNVSLNVKKQEKADILTVNPVTSSPRVKYESIQ